ncbi:hypothetical protein [Microbacterium sp. VKM Ac-2923]|uniref:hypothetical protein n=1 Tax=Microbacterium sp. VKM Ac-2923 TaxID=2929476 RepID=UPI001FB389D8|nr:hypothetical protein [Microbacterium sp. VKM Ac-2923]MCJ1708712.1 hypothetical protein [Microbacterium sp. VKM Ac-2923]
MSNEEFTLPDGLAVRDEALYQQEVTNLAGRIIADDKPGIEFDRIYRTSGSLDYANEVAADAVLWVSRMALSGEVVPAVTATYARRIQEFIMSCKMLAAWK